MVDTTTVVATATLTTLAELRTSCVKAETTPYLLRSTTLMMLLLLGELNNAVPELCSIIMPIISPTDDCSLREKAKTNAPAAVRDIPPMVKACQPNRSESRPLNGPITTMHSAAGIIINPTCSGEYANTRCK